MADLLKIENLELKFNTRHGIVKVLDNISFTLKPGEIFGVAGESGSGKSMTAMALMRLIDKKLIHSIQGKIFFRDTNLLELPEKEFRKLRGNKIAMIFQEPMTSLNPVFSIGFQITETLLLHQNLKPKEADEKAIDLLARVGLPDPKKRLKNYPHELSGGQRQRVMIAMAISCRPDVLIADEPTTALDTTVQAQIFDLLLDIQQELNTAIILITHDMGVLAQMADEIAVMYAGRIVEQGLRDQILDTPEHPYTQSLIACIPKVDVRAEAAGKPPADLSEIAGVVPPLAELSTLKGCSFAGRCPKVFDTCSTLKPPHFRLNKTQTAACHLLEK